jgi:hypothetical protein
MKYKVEVTHTENTFIEVEADSEMEARDLALDEADGYYDEQRWERVGMDTEVVEKQS